MSAEIVSEILENAWLNSTSERWIRWRLGVIYGLSAMTFVMWTRSKESSDVIPRQVIY